MYGGGTHVNVRKTYVSTSDQYSQLTLFVRIPSTFLTTRSKAKKEFCTGGSRSAILFIIIVFNFLSILTQPTVRLA